MATLANGTNGVPQSNGVPHPNGHSHELNGETLRKTTNSYAAKFDLADHFIGGNRLEKAPAGLVKDFVLHNDGHTVITNVDLI